MVAMNLPSLALVQQLEDVLSDARRFRRENIQKLEEIRGSMIEAGFNAPFSGILQRTMREAEELEEAEWVDLKKQVSYFREIANLKKYSLLRASIALSAHRLADHFLRMGYADIVEHAPLDGNHIGLLMSSGAEGILAYRTIMDRFEMMAEPSACYSVKVRSKGETHTLKMEDKERIDYQVAQMFGLEAEVLEIKPAIRRKAIISSKGTRVALVASVVDYVAKSVEAEMEMEEGEPGNERLREYNQFMRERGLRPDVRIDQVDDFKGIKDELVGKGVLSLNDGRYEMERGLAEKITLRKRERKKKVLERSTMLVLAPMFRFYLATSRETRKKENLYPGMAVVPTPSQARIFTFISEVDPDIPATAVIRKKMQLEESGMRMDSQRIAAAILLQETKKSSKWIADFLRMEEKDVLASKLMLSSIEEGGRGAEFLKQVRGSGTEGKEI
ncbi:MAG: DUF530 family protein [Candidatus Bilamarchaeaceae archaeon]